MITFANAPSDTSAVSAAELLDAEVGSTWTDCDGDVIVVAVDMVTGDRRYIMLEMETDGRIGIRGTVEGTVDLLPMSDFEPYTPCNVAVTVTRG